MSQLFLAGATSPGDRGLTGFAPQSFDRAAGPERAGLSLGAHLGPSMSPSILGPALWARTGDTGAASAGLALIATLDGSHEDDQILLTDAEGAGAAAFALKLSKKPDGTHGLLDEVKTLRTHLSWHSYLGHRRYTPDANPPHTRSEGAYVSPASWEETLEARLGLLASRCRACSRVRHPPRTTCPDCGEAGGQVFQARPEGALHAFTRIGRGGAPSEFALQQRLVGEYAVAVVEMADGFRMVAQISGADPNAVKIGDAVHLRMRRLFEQEGRIRYGLKAIPVGPEHRPAAGSRKD